MFRAPRALHAEARARCSWQRGYPKRTISGSQEYMCILGARAEAYRIALWDHITGLDYGMILWDNLEKSYYVIVLRDNITELYHETILPDNIMELCHRIILWD